MEKNLEQCHSDLMESIASIHNRSISIEAQSQEIIEKLKKTKLNLMEEIYDPAFNINTDERG